MKNKNLSGGLFAAKPTPLTIRETSLSAQIAEWLEARNIYNDRLQCGAMKTLNGSWLLFCKAGTPDRFAIIRGQIVFIEVKKFGEKPSELQLKKHSELRQSGAVVIVADNFNKFVSEFTAICSQIIKAQSKEIKLYD
ncbi:MAG: VRR-NUC domain-containing protein [Pyrinomonadaceae bacterium]|nr:VRR-NUC domain-containing protein [Pyrinomonadaceae bacterium]